MTEPYPVDDAKIEPHQRYPRSRTIRGLILQIQAGNIRLDGRRLVKDVDKSGKGGTCVWCSEPTRARQKWHQDCVQAYFVAINTFVNPLTDDSMWRVCVECFKRGHEVDHDYPLALARVHCLEGRRKWWKAWTISNLKWLCTECHEVKTKRDVRDIAAAKRRLKDREAGVMTLLDVS